MIGASLRTQKMIEMRNEGHTYQEIADVFGISKQAVHNYIKKAKECHLRRDKECEKIVFQGIYDFFKAEPKMNYTTFTSMIYDCGISRKNVVKTSRFITGKTESYLRLKDILRICEICGTSFEDTFKRREGR